MAFLCAISAWTPVATRCLVSSKSASKAMSQMLRALTNDGVEMSGYVLEQSILRA